MKETIKALLELFATKDCLVSHDVAMIHSEKCTDIILKEVGKNYKNFLDPEKVDRINNILNDELSRVLQVEKDIQQLKNSLCVARIILNGGERIEDADHKKNFNKSDILKEVKDEEFTSEFMKAITPKNEEEINPK